VTDLRGLDTNSASKEARMNNVLRNYR